MFKNIDEICLFIEMIVMQHFILNLINKVYYLFYILILLPGTTLIESRFNCYLSITEIWNCYFG